MPRGKRVLKEVTEEKQTKIAKKPSTRGSRTNKKMETEVTSKTTTTKKRKTKAEAVGHVDDEVPPSKRAKAPTKKKVEPVEETDRAGDPVVVETHQSKTKQIKKTKTTTRTDHNTIKDVASNLAPISHPSHGSRPGQVMTLGQGDMGQLGLGEDIAERKKPFPVGGELEGKKIVQVVCGGMHTVALTEDGQVYTWGCNDEGALGRKTGDGDEYLPSQVENIDGVKIVQVSGGDSHTAALVADGNVYSWGVFRDSNGPFGLTKPGVPTPLPEIIYSSTTNRAVKIASGSDHIVILTDQGDLLSLGCAEQGQLGRVPECFSSRGGRKGVQTLLEPQPIRFRKVKGVPKPKFVDVFCGPYHTFARAQNDRLYAWGLNNYGQLGVDDTDSRYNPELLPTDWIKDENSPEPTKCENLDISGGQHHTVVCQNGRVYTLGRKEYGRLGLGENSDEPRVPRNVPDVNDVIRVAAGSACTFAVTKSGDVYSCGMGTNLQLGSGEEDDLWSFTKILGKKLENRDVIASSAGGQHTALLVSLPNEPME